MALSVRGLSELSVAQAAAVVLATSSCAPAPAPAPLPRDREDWEISYVDVPDRDSRDLLPSFLESAKALGCSTKKGGADWVGLPGGGRWRTYSAVLARCEEGAIMLGAVDVHRVMIACPKPATREQCNVLLGQISAARR